MPNTLRKEGFSQVCIWPACIVNKKEGDVQEFEAWMYQSFTTRVQYLEEIVTGENTKDGVKIPGTGGRTDVFFAVHSDDIGRFALARMEIGIRWIEDVLAECNQINGRWEDLYPARVYEYATWNFDNIRKPATLQVGAIGTEDSEEDQSQYVPGTHIAKPAVRLLGENGNAFHLMGRVVSALRKAKVPNEVIDQYTKSCMLGDCNSILEITLRYVDVK